MQEPQELIILTKEKSEKIMKYIRALKLQITQLENLNKGLKPENKCI